MEFICNISPYSEVNFILKNCIGAFTEVLGGNLKGLYLHGSLAMGCFRPWSSDIDLLAVVYEPMDRETKLTLVRKIMDIAEAGEEFRSVEFSIVTEEEALRAAHPIHYILHYSNSWHQAYKEGRADLVIQGGADEDLAAHFTVTRDRGIALYGAPIEETIGVISRSDYLKSVWYDIAGSEEQVVDKPVYTVLNLCRTWMYLKTNRVSSKLEGGQWAATQPQLARWKVLIEAAANEYATGEAGVFDKEELIGFAQGMIDKTGNNFA
jgi:predicted nucleotidyltransferase